jgi:hypothetical protein
MAVLANWKRDMRFWRVRTPPHSPADAQLDSTLDTEHWLPRDLPTEIPDLA